MWKEFEDFQLGVKDIEEFVSDFERAYKPSWKRSDAMSTQRILVLSRLKEDVREHIQGVGQGGTGTSQRSPLS